MHGEKWLVSDPGFLVTIGFMGLFNWWFDQYFRAAVSVNPTLSLLYMFQYHLILPMINVVFLSGILFVGKKLRASNYISRYRCGDRMRKLLLSSLVLGILIFGVFSLPVWAKPKSGTSGDSDVAHVLLVTKTDTWESIWPGAFGKVKYQIEGNRFVGLITVHGLKPETEYVLAVNGPGGSATDDLIASAAQADNDYPSLWDGWWDDEGYYDFASVTSNKGGNLEYKFSATLPTGTYLWVKFLVKDTTIGWETILMEDAALTFTIS